MSEQYRCTECGHFVEIRDDVICDVCHIGKMEHLRYIKGGNGSHWEGCEEVHWDCKIVHLEAELSRLTAELAELRERFEVTDDLLNHATHELAAYQLRIRELEARWKIAETDVMDIVGSALSGDCEKYQYFDRNGKRYVRWGIVGNDLRAVFYNHTDHYANTVCMEQKHVIDRLNAGRRWIPVSERLPEEGVEVLVFDEKGDYLTDCLRRWQNGSLNWEVSFWENDGDGVTHWMPLPPPPEEE